MKKEDYLIGVQFPNKRSPRDFNMTLIAMQKFAEDYHEEQLRQIDEAEIMAINESEDQKRENDAIEKREIDLLDYDYKLHVGNVDYGGF